MTDAPATVWARENPVWATVFPVAQTVVSESPPVRPVEEGGFRVDFGGILRELTKRPLLLLNFTTNCQNLMRHAGVISERGSRWWLSCPFSRLTNVKGVIAHPCAENSAECCNFADGSPCETQREKATWRCPPPTSGWVAIATETLGNNAIYRIPEQNLWKLSPPLAPLWNRR